VLARAAARGLHREASDEFLLASALAGEQRALDNFAMHGAALHSLLANQDGEQRPLIFLPDEVRREGPPVRLEVRGSQSTHPVWAEALDLARARIVGVPRAGAECGCGDLVAYKLHFPYAVRDRDPDALLGTGSPSFARVLSSAGMASFEVLGSKMSQNTLLLVIADLRAADYFMDPWSCMTDSPFYEPMGILAAGLAVYPGNNPQKNVARALEALDAVGRNREVALHSPQLAAASGDEIGAARQVRAARLLGHRV
jgi:hypothetical protein